MEKYFSEKKIVVNSHNLGHPNDDVPIEFCCTYNGIEQTDITQYPNVKSIVYISQIQKSLFYILFCFSFSVLMLYLTASFFESGAMTTPTISVSNGHTLIEEKI